MKTEEPNQRVRSNNIAKNQAAAFWLLKYFVNVVLFTIAYRQRMRPISSIVNIQPRFARLGATIRPVDDIYHTSKSLTGMVPSISGTRYMSFVHMAHLLRSVFRK